MEIFYNFVFFFRKNLLCFFEWKRTMHENLTQKLQFSQWILSICYCFSYSFVNIVCFLFAKKKRKIEDEERKENKIIHLQNNDYKIPVCCMNKLKKGRWKELTESGEKKYWTFHFLCVYINICELRAISSLFIYSCAYVSLHGSMLCLHLTVICSIFLSCFMDVELILFVKEYIEENNVF